MKKTLALLLALIPIAASAVAPTYATTVHGISVTCASGSCDAPTASTDGLALWSAGRAANGIAVTVCADSGQTLSGAGTLTAYVYSSDTSLWAAVPDLNLTVTSSSIRCQSFAGFAVAMANPNDRITWVPTSVTISSGGTKITLTTSY